MRTETIVGLFVITAIGIFFYLSFSIGSFRFDTRRYDQYSAYFNDTTGLEVKDPIRIAGVTVGAVKEINLIDDRAHVVFWIQKQFKLGNNAHAVIRQQGLLGNSHIEIDPGDSTSGYLSPGSALKLPSQSPPMVSELVSKFSDIATSVKAVASSLENTIASRSGEDNIRVALEGFARASDRIANFSEVLERSLKQNEETINQTLQDFKEVAMRLRQDSPQILHDTSIITAQLSQDTVPAFTDASRNVSLLSQKVGTAFDTFENAAGSAHGGFNEAQQVFEKLNTGKGVLGKLINEEETYRDLRTSIKAIKDYAKLIDNLEILIDMHSETMLRDWNSKGYFEMRVRPSNDYFYLFQLLTDEKGTVQKQRVFERRFDCKGNQLCAPNATALYDHPDAIEIDIQTKNAILFGLQFGKRFDRLVFRTGLFESTFGMAVDYYVPLPTNKLHWITTMELFDIKGNNRVCDTRPHLKWINRVFILKNLYTVFGIDDFISKNNANPFIGGGIRFNDKDLKYLLSSIPIGSIASAISPTGVIAVN